MSGDPTGAPQARRFFWPELQGVPLIRPADEETTFTDGKRLLSRLQQPPFDSNGWAFRGQANERWGLEHSLERMYTQYLASEVKVEEFVIAEFRRRAHHYTPIPPTDDMGEWLALMRHSGAPTRLLDWTRSPYIAAYFAAPDSKMGDTSAIWAIDLLAIKKAVAAVFESSHGAAQTNVPLELPSVDRFMKFEDPLVIPVEPCRSNERLTAQQGLFLCQSTLTFSFEVCLKHVLRVAQETTTTRALWKINIAPSARPTLMSELYRMNISEATLFPGLDGFARSLATRAKYEALRENTAAGEEPAT